MPRESSARPVSPSKRARGSGTRAPKRSAPPSWNSVRWRVAWRSTLWSEALRRLARCSSAAPRVAPSSRAPARSAPQRDASPRSAPRQVGPRQLGAVEPGRAQVRAGQDRPAEVAPDEVGPAQVAAPEVARPPLPLLATGQPILVRPDDPLQLGVERPNPVAFVSGDPGEAIGGPLAIATVEDVKSLHRSPLVSSVAPGGGRRGPGGPWCRSRETNSRAALHDVHHGQGESTDAVCRTDRNPSDANFMPRADDGPAPGGFAREER